jgi:hypothetical protein
MNVLARSRSTSLALLAVVVLLGGCASQSYRYDDSAQRAVESRGITQQAGAFTVTASVPSNSEAEVLFGLPIEDRGIQAVWLEIDNRGELRARFAPYSVDPEYFPPHEVAYMFRKQFPRKALENIENRLSALSLPRKIAPLSKVSGYVFTHADPGTKAFNVDLHYVQDDAPNEHFTFFINVPGFEPDHASVNFAGLYAADEISDYSTEEFRSVLGEWPCCTTNFDGGSEGRPWNVLFVSHGTDLLRALLRAGWLETSLSKNDNYLNNIDYLFERPPDARFRLLRDEGSNRNEMAVWLAPVRVDGKPVWVGQVKHAISRMFGLGDYFFGIRIDPDVNEGRNYLLQNIWYSQSLLAFAFVAGGADVPSETPRLDFNGQPWFSDPYRLVLWVSGEPVSLRVAKDLKWDLIAEYEGAADE